MGVKRIYNKNGDYSKTCPNCGAAIENDKCAYCGTTFIDFACTDADKPFFLKIKHKGEIFLTNVQLSGVTVESSSNDLYCGNGILFSVPDINISLDFHVVNILEVGKDD